MKQTKKILGLAIMAVLMLTCLTGCGGEKDIDVMYDMTVEFTGVNGEGRATYGFETTEMGFIQALVNAGDEKMESFEDLTRLNAIAGTVDFKVEPSGSLSNGDKVTLTATVDSDALKELGYSAKTTSKTFTVEGLDVPVEIDPFQDYEVSFSDISPNAHIQYERTRNMDGVTVSYNCENDGFLRLGGTAVITASVSDSKRYILTEGTKEFPVEGVDSYILQAADVPGAIWQDMKSQAEKLWENGAFYREHDSEEFEYIGYAFWSRKEGFSVSMPNSCYLVYKVTVHDDEGDFRYYYFYQFENLIQYADGNWDVGIPYFDSKPSDTFQHNGVSETGFETLEALMGKIASEKEAGYDLETTLS